MRLLPGRCSTIIAGRSLTASSRGVGTASCAAVTSSAAASVANSARSSGEPARTTTLAPEANVTSHGDPPSRRPRTWTTSAPGAVSCTAHRRNASSIGATLPGRRQRRIDDTQPTGPPRRTQGNTSGRTRQ